MYIPKNKIKKNQYTLGDKYVLPVPVSVPIPTGGVDIPKVLPYFGFYYLLYNGDAFTGKNPGDGLNKKLIPIKTYLEMLKASSIAQAYNLITKSKDILTLLQHQPLPVYYPKPTEQDYKQGFMTRYFAKRRNGGSITIEETTREAYEDIMHMKGKYDYNLYSVISLYWQVSGPLHDDNSNPNFPKPGIIDTNKRILAQKEQKMPGITKHLSNLSEFTKNI